jgi:serine/threonine-protein kinase CTR1
MDLPAAAGGGGRRTSYSLLSQFPDDPAAPAAAVLQRQSSGGSSYGPGSSLSASSDYPFNHLPPAGTAGGTPSPCKSWAQQAEETYQLQLALALRLCADAACAADPGFLDPGGDGKMMGGGSGSGRAFPLAPPMPTAEALSHRFWVSSRLASPLTRLSVFLLLS